jgi:hypothetical protein
LSCPFARYNLAVYEGSIIIATSLGDDDSLEEFYGYYKEGLVAKEDKEGNSIS